MGDFLRNVTCFADNYANILNVHAANQYCDKSRAWQIIRIIRLITLIGLITD